MGSVRTISLALACGENVARRLTSISTTIAKPLFLVDMRSLVNVDRYPSCIFDFLEYLTYTHYGHLIEMTN